METHDHQSPVDAAMPHGASSAPTENMTAQAQGTASVSPEPATQAMPGQTPGGQASSADASHAASVDPSAQTAIPDQQAQTVSQSPQAPAAGQQAQFKTNVIMDPATGQLYYAMPHEPSVAPTENMTAQAPDTAAQVSPEPATQTMPGQAQASPPNAAQPTCVDPSAQTAIPDQQAQTAGQQTQFKPNVIMDPATGQLYYAMPSPQGQPVQQPPLNGQYVYYTTPPEQAPEPHQPDYAQIIKSVEDFAEGDASVADVVKTLWTETSQDDQFWKGAVVGAAAAVLLTSQTMRGAMGKTFGGLFGKNAADAAAAPSPAPDLDPKTK